jgi:hypothetical protein
MKNILLIFCCVLFFAPFSAHGLEIRNRSAIKFILSVMNAHKQQREEMTIEHAQETWDPHDRTVLTETNIDFDTPLILTVIDGWQHPDRCHLSINNRTGAHFTCQLRNTWGKSLVDDTGYLLARDRQIPPHEQMVLIDLQPFFALGEHIQGNTIILTRKKP